MIVPLGVIRPIAGVLPSSVNQRLPSGPAVTVNGTLPGFSPRLKTVSRPLGVSRRIEHLPSPIQPRSANQRLPSGPGASPNR